MSGAVYREATVPPTERCFKLVLRPLAWKARLWRAFDGSATVLLRLDTSLHIGDIEDRNLAGLLMPFSPALAKFSVYLERGAAAPLPLPWSVGWLSAEHDHAVSFLHHVVDDPFGNALAALFGSRGSNPDLTLSIVPYEISSDRIKFAMRDYDIGIGGDFAS